MPRILGPVTADRWEQEVRRQFAAQLPGDWVVICNVAWSVRNGDRVQDGQSDFVVLIPGHGMVIAEVKGSRMVRVGEDGCWYAIEYTRGQPTGNEVRLKEPPPEQATRNAHQLAEIVTKAGGWPHFPGAFAYVVIYPNGEIVASSPLMDASTLVTKKHMHDLAGRLRGALVARNSERTGKAFGVTACEEVAAILAKLGFQIYSVDTEVEAQEDDQTIDQLTRQQFAALKGAFELPRVAILGPAGSGKTVLALWKLKALLEEGRRALYVCFNKALAEYLRIKNPECAGAIVSVDAFFRGIGKPPAMRGEAGEYFSELLPQHVLDESLQMGSGEKYEAIIVDEGQDFGDLRTIALLELLRGPEAQWVFFADWNQDVYRTKSDTPLGAEVVFRLYHNCRNTISVTVATNRYCAMTVEPMPGSPQGEPPLLDFRKTPATVAMRAWEIVHELAPAGGAAILGPYKLENSCMAGNVRGHGLELTQDPSKLGMPEYVYYSTVRAFKGLEAGVVVVVQVEPPDSIPSLSLEDLYVACTRARSRLAIVAGSESAHGWFASHLK